jgi:DNA-binding transcriptional ArsR family regulator
MVTKDWFKTEFEDKTPQLLEILKVVRQALEKHEAAMQKRFESIQSALEKLTGVAKRAPKPIRREILKEVQAIKRQVPLSQKMQRLLAIVKESGEISYDELGAKLGITTSALRGLLSNTLKRTNKLKRYTRERKGWVKYVEAL